MIESILHKLAEIKPHLNSQQAKLSANSENVNFCNKIRK